MFRVSRASFFLEGGGGEGGVVYGFRLGGLKYSAVCGIWGLGFEDLGVWGFKV